jgi:hypothetical protein
MRAKATIVLEDKFKDVLAYLKPSSTASGIFKHTFMSGTEKQLEDFMIQNKSKSIYPLIWLLSPYNEVHFKNKTEFENLQLVFAVETNSTMLNDERLVTTYSSVLMPLFHDFKRVITRANNFNVKDDIGFVKYYNHSNDAGAGEKHKTSYIWDAIRISVTGYVTPNCLRKIY